MGIEIFLSNGYLWLFVTSLFIVGFDVIYFLEKVRDKLSAIEDRIKDNLKQKYKDKSIKINDAILIHSKLSQNKSLFGNVNYYLQLNLWSGILFPIFSLIGLVSNLTNSNEGLAIILLFGSTIMFSITLIILIIYYINKLK